MTSRAAEPAYDAGAWAALSRRLSPYLDLALGLLAAGFAVLSLLSTSLASVDPRLHDADVLAVGATLVAGLSLAWRRRRPVTAFAVFVVCCLVVVLRPLHRAALGDPAVQPVLPDRARPSATRRCGGPGGVAPRVRRAGAPRHPRPRHR